MWYATLAATLAVSAALAACQERHPISCPKTSGNGPPVPSVIYNVQFVNEATGRASPIIKPKAVLPTSDPGLCIDQATGDIHLYHQQATDITLIFTFDPSLNMFWPTDAVAAFDVSPDAIYQKPEVSGDQQSLTVHLRAKDQGQRYPYVATYLDGQGNPFHTEPAIQNH